MKKLCCLFLIAFVMPLSAHAHESQWEHNFATVFEVLNNTGTNIRLSCAGTPWYWRGPGRHCFTCNYHKLWYTPFSTGSQQWLVKAKSPTVCNEPNEVRVTLTCDGLYCITVSASRECVSESVGQC